MGQDSEAAAELVATIRGDHVVMKKWFQGPSPEAAALRQKYGDYPGLWKEVLNWPGWKEARKAYLNHSEGTSEKTEVPRKRRSRWGSAEDTTDNGGPPNKRKSRWAKDPVVAAAPAPAVPILPGLPGMPATLTPEQQREMNDLQTRLRSINEKIANLESEAARVDALPRGHRERSPSPPPGKFLCDCCFVSLYCHYRVLHTLTSFSFEPSTIFSLRRRRKARQYSCRSLERTLYKRTKRYSRENHEHESSYTSKQRVSTQALNENSNSH
jgi:hypothetical protein